MLCPSIALEGEGADSVHLGSLLRLLELMVDRTHHHQKLLTSVHHQLQAVPSMCLDGKSYN